MSVPCTICKTYEGHVQEDHNRYYEESISQLIEAANITADALRSLGEMVEILNKRIEEIER